VAAVRIEHQVTIEAPPWRVFDVLTKDVGAWWGVPYLIGTPKKLVLEAQIGGRFYEEWTEGGGVLWATVTSLKRGDHLELTGSLGMRGTVHGRARLTFEAQGGATVLRLCHEVLGDVSGETQRFFLRGWHDLLGVRLKAFVETGKRYGLGHDPPPASLLPEEPIEPAEPARRARKKPEAREPDPEKAPG
jgi:uncharacterized protein YndB with AHSA1/START domain